MSNNNYNFDTTNTDTAQEYDFLTMSVPVAPISFEELLFGTNSQTDYSAIEPIPHVQNLVAPVHSTNPVCCKTEFRDFEHQTNLSSVMPYAAHDTQLAHNLMSRIEQDYASIQCESETARDMLLSTYANPYLNIFDISVQEMGHDDDDKHLYRYTYGRKDDIYSSIWYRNLIDGNERDGGERYCAPCDQWYNTRNHAWANHMTSVHGISAVTKTVYPFPSGVVVDKRTHKLKGWCPKCEEYVHLYIKKVGTVWTTWFRHQDAHIRKEMQDRRGGKISTPNNPRNSKKRAIEMVEEAEQVEQPQASSSVDVSASNTVLDFEFQSKKRCFEVEIEQVEQVQEVQEPFLLIDPLLTVESVESVLTIEPLQTVEPLQTFEPFQTVEPVQTVVEPVELPSFDADYSVGEVQNMMDFIELEQEINMELAATQEEEDNTENANDEDDTEDTETNEIDSEEQNTDNTEDTEDTSPEEEGEFKYNPFEGHFDDCSSLFGDYTF